jgi:hypothetical protein
VEETKAESGRDKRRLGSKCTEQRGSAKTVVSICCTRSPLHLLH